MIGCVRDEDSNGILAVDANVYPTSGANLFANLSKMIFGNINNDEGLENSSSLEDLSKYKNKKRGVPPMVFAEKL